jgi:mannose-6-phosphate isomerase-like protein (cupin superfamily)
MAVRGHARAARERDHVGNASRRRADETVAPVPAAAPPRRGDPEGQPVKHVNVAKNRAQFKVVLDGTSSQAAMMTLKQGQSSSDRPENEHPEAEQWVFVVSGTGRAKGRSRSIPLRPGSLLLVAKNEPHQISQSGEEPLVTINFYAPAAYSTDGEVKRSVKRR